jgi:hypothetical protein
VRDDRSGTDDRVTANSNSWHNDGPDSDEYIIFDSDGCDHIEVWVFVSEHPDPSIVRHKLNTAGECHMIADAYEIGF